MVTVHNQGIESNQLIDDMVDDQHSEVGKTEGESLRLEPFVLPGSLAGGLGLVCLFLSVAIPTVASIEFNQHWVLLILGLLLGCIIFFWLFVQDMKRYAAYRKAYLCRLKQIPMREIGAAIESGLTDHETRRVLIDFANKYHPGWTQGLAGSSSRDGSMPHKP